MFFLRCGDLEILSLPFSVRNLVRRSSLSSCMENIRAASRTASGRIRSNVRERGMGICVRRPCGRGAACGRRTQGPGFGKGSAGRAKGRAQGWKRGEDGAPGKTGKTQGKKGLACNGAGREWYPGESPGKRPEMCGAGRGACFRGKGKTTE